MFGKCLKDIVVVDETILSDKLFLDESMTDGDGMLVTSDDVMLLTGNDGDKTND